MSIELILSSLDVDCTRELTDIFMQYSPLEQSERIRFVFPSSVCARHFSHNLLTHDGFPGLLGDPVRSWKDFLLELVQHSVHHIGLPEREMIIAALVAECRDGNLSGMARFAGFPHALEETLDLLRRSSLRGDDLRRACGERGDTTLPDMALMLDRYEEALADCSACDDESLADICCDLVSRKETLGLSLDCLILYGFKQLSTRHMQALSDIVSHMAERTRVLIHVSYDVRCPGGYRNTERLYKTVSGMQGTAIKEIHRTESANSPGRRAVLALTRDKLSRTADGAIIAMKCRDRLSEIEMVVGKVSSLVDEGLMPSQIGICSPGIDLYRDQLQISLRRKKIPVVGESYPLLRSRLAETIRLAVEITSQGWSRDLVESYLRNLGVRDGIHSVLNAAKTANPSDRSTWLCHWPNDESYDYKRLLLEPIAALEDACSTATAVNALTVAIAAFASTHEVPSSIHECRIDSAAWKAIQSMLAEIPWEGSSDTAIGWLISRMKYRRIALTNVDGEGIALLSLDQVSGMRFRYIFILGLVSELQIERFGLLGQAEMKLVQEAYPDSIPDMSATRESDRFAFFSAVSAASETAYLSYPMSSSSGQRLGPSRWISEIGIACPNMA